MYIFYVIQFSIFQQHGGLKEVLCINLSGVGNSGNRDNKLEEEKDKIYIFFIKLDGVGPVENRPSID